MGRLATVINAVALQDALEKDGVFTRVLSAIEMKQVAEPFIRRRATRHLEKGRIVIFAAGTGNPYFSTDTAAALRAMEMKADVILKATRVDGIYDADPEQVADAKLFQRITYRDRLHHGLKGMDSTAISLCMDNGMPIVVFNMNTHGNIKRVVLGERVGSTVTPAWNSLWFLVLSEGASRGAHCNSVYRGFPRHAREAPHGSAPRVNLRWFETKT